MNPLLVAVVVLVRESCGVRRGFELGELDEIEGREFDPRPRLRLMAQKRAQCKIVHNVRKGAVWDGS